MPDQAAGDVFEAIASPVRRALLDRLTSGPRPVHDPRRLLDFPALLNVRDLGGYPTIDGGHTRWRAVVRAA